MSFVQWAILIAHPVEVERPDHSPPQLRVALMTSSLALQGLVRLVISALVGRHAGPTALAQVAAGLAVASILSLLWPSATGAAASRFVAAARAHPDEGEARRVTAHLGRRTLQACTLLAPIAGTVWLLRGGSVDASLVVAGLTAGLGGYAFIRGVHNGASQLVRLVTWDCTLSFVGILATVWMLRSGHDGVVVLAPLAAVYLLLTAGGWPRRGVGTTTSASDIDHFILWGTIGSLASAGLIHVTMIVAAHRLPGLEAGQFAAALNLVAPAALLANSFSLALFPQISATFARGDNAAAIAMTSRATDVMTFIMGGTFGGLTLFAPWIVSTIWGSEFSHAATIFAVLAIGPLCRAVSMPAVTSISSRDRTGVRQTGTSTFAGALLATLIWIMMPEAGWAGVAAGYSAAMALTAAQNVVTAARRDHSRWCRPWIILALGALAIGLLCDFRDRQDLNLLTTLILGSLALLLWTAVNWPTVRSLTKI